MAEESAAEKTEEATSRKRQQSREQGQVALSKDLNASVILFMVCLFLRYGGDWMTRETVNVIADIINSVGTIPIPEHIGIAALVPGWVYLFVRIVAPVLILAFVTALLINFAQAGVVFSSEALNLKLERLDPIKGFKRLFELRAIMTLLMGLFKIALVTSVAYAFFVAILPTAASLSGVSAQAMGAYAALTMVDLMLRLAAVLLILGLFDYWYQRFQQERDMRMTKQEIKEEMRDTEGDPHVKSRRRQIQRQMAMQRMMSEVPGADVVVKNPTHYAVALKYDPDTDPQPFVVAKGMNNVALKIVKLAVENNVPIKHQPQLARDLYRNLEVGESIPPELYQAVAEVFSWLVQTGKNKRLAAGLGV